MDAFQHVYMARDYTEAGHDLNTNRKGIRRMIERLEKTFQCTLFLEQERGQLQPSPFAERLFNDLRFLNAAQQTLEDHVLSIRESGRLLRIGSSAAIFRTQTFRNLFRELQSTEGVRASYVSTKGDEATKALASGTCDLHVGCWQGNTKRFLCHKVGEIEFKVIVRRGAKESPDRVASAFYLSIDGTSPQLPSAPGVSPSWRPLPESELLLWLDHPEDCPAGTRILAPNIPHDIKHWETPDDTQVQTQPIYINFLRQHPYEFLTALGSGLQTRMNKK